MLYLLQLYRVPEVVEGKVDDTLSVMADEVAEVAEKNNVNW